MTMARQLSRTAGVLTVVLAALVTAADLGAQALAPEVLKAFNFRAIGP